MIDIEREIKTILDLKTNEYIGKELANRQLDVIIKGYQYLINPANNLLYIADEVGLGKTYIAAGIALLLRHFSNNSEEHKDVIIVPKKNLQDKWEKELRNFVSKNYRSEKEHVRSAYTLEGCKKDRIKPISNNEPLTIFRMTSFSSIVNYSNSRKDLKEHFIYVVFNNDKLAGEVINKAYDLGYFYKDNFRKLRNLIAYLMNALSPKINCLIIDEAHNYKYGPGNDDQEESIRNEATARFLGAVKDKDIFKDFPQLEGKVKYPLANSVICLSATPKDRNLYEIKQQLSCFTNKHLLSNAKTNSEIESSLKSFLIRGNLEYILKEETVSRNQCRVEHRQGNVNKSEVAIPLVVNDTFESVFWQLIQYKSIKHLNQKNNASFEIGMLAGFETYNVDVDKKNSKQQQNENESESNDDSQKEYEQTEHRNIKESQDINIVKGIITSYNETFKEQPPHPKQTKLESEIISQLSNQDKSLIFVRRIASSVELEKRILERYEKEIVINQQLKQSRKFLTQENGVVDKIIEAYNKRKTKEKLNEVLEKLLTKIEIRDSLFECNLNDQNYKEQGLLWLTIAYNKQVSNTAYKKHIEDYFSKNLKNISSEFKNSAIDAIKDSYNDFISNIGNEEEELKEDEAHSGYFFLDYFKKDNEGFSYRTKMYRENWFEINPIILNNHFNFIEYNAVDLNNNLNTIVAEKKKSQTLKKETDTVYNYFIEKGILRRGECQVKNDALNGELKNTTFLTQLICDYCHGEMDAWLNKRLNKINIEEFVLDLKILNTILRNIFRNGSGLLPGYLADSQNESSEDLLFRLMTVTGSPFYFILDEVKKIIKDFDLLISTNFDKKDEVKIGTILKNIVPVIGTSGQDKRNRGIIAAQFRMPGMPYVLITTDIFREGEDLHTYCQNIYHYGIAWNPSDMEQRTGRIDRINSLSYRKLNHTQELKFDNKIQVFYPYLKHSVEVNQVVQLFLNLNKFIETFNDISLDNKYESKVAITNEVEENQIPEPFKERLKSIYDVDNFIAL